MQRGDETEATLSVSALSTVILDWTGFIGLLKLGKSRTSFQPSLTPLDLVHGAAVTASRSANHGVVLTTAAWTRRGPHWWAMLLHRDPA